MLRVIAAALVLAGGFGAAALQGQTYGATVTAERGVDFTKFHTYTWRRSQPAADKTVDAQIVAAIDRELESLGMTKATDGPSDVVVTYASLTRTDVDLKGKTDSKGLLPQYWVGTLVVLFHDPASNRQLLRMRADLPIDTKPEQLQAAINRAAALMFAKYPTRKPAR